jgi:hypothetical protein
MIVDPALDLAGGAFAKAGLGRVRYVVFQSGLRH